MNVTAVFRSLQYPNYRLYFVGQSISLIGTWMQRMAVSWLVYRLTGSALMLGVVTFAGQIPTFLLSPYGGVLSDRYDRYKILLTTQVAAMIQASVLAALVLTNHYSIGAIIFLSALLGIINAFDTPSRQALMVVLVEKREDLPNAIALNSSMVNLARLLGPTVAGIILAQYGEGTCFLLNAFSFVAVIGSLLAMRLPKEEFQKPTTNVWEDWREGYQYLRNADSLGMVIVMMAFVSFLVMPYSTLLPVMAKDVFAGNAGTYGLLNGFTGAGALAAAFSLALLRSDKWLRQIVLLATFTFGSFLLLFSITTSLPLALVWMIGTGSGMIACIAAGNTLIQTRVEDRMRGRVMSFYTMAFFGMQPLGSFVIGTVADHIGARYTLGMQGVAGILIALIFMRPLLKKKTQLDSPLTPASGTMATNTATGTVAGTVDEPVNGLAR